MTNIRFFKTKYFYYNSFNKRRIIKNDGSTMIETIVAFAVLMIVLGLLYKMVVFSSDLRMKASDTANVRSSFNEQLYKKEYDDSGSRIDGAMENVKIVDYYGVDDPNPANSNTAAFVIVLDEEKTDVEKAFGAPSGDEADNVKNQITFPHLDATSYSSVDPLIDSEGLATPNVLKFRYAE